MIVDKKLAIASQKYPIGTRFISPDSGEVHTVKTNTAYLGIGGEIITPCDDHYSFHLLYSNNKWAEIVSKPFTLPDKWCVKGGHDLKKVLSKWEKEHKNKIFSLNGFNKELFYFPKSVEPVDGVWDWSSNDSKGENTEISLDELKQYVLKQEPITPKVTYTVSRSQMESIYNFGYTELKNKIKDLVRTHFSLFGDSCVLTHDDVKSIFDIAVPMQIPELEKIFPDFAEEKNPFIKSELSNLIVREMSKKVLGDDNILQVLGASTPDDRIDLNSKAFYVSGDYHINVGEAKNGTYIEIVKKETVK